MNELIVGQILAIFILLLAMSYMVGGKTLSAKVARWHLKQLKSAMKWILRQVAGKKARSIYWRALKRAGRGLRTAMRWTWSKVRP